MELHPTAATLIPVRHTAGRRRITTACRSTSLRSPLRNARASGGIRSVRGSSAAPVTCDYPSMWHSGAHRPAVLMIAAIGVLLSACGRFSATDLGSIRAEVSALPDPARWVRDGGLHYDCESINLDCTNTSSGLRFRSSASTADACAGLVAWVNSTSAFVGPTAVIRLITSKTPSVDDCTSEMTTRGRYLIKAAGPTSVSTSAGLGWQVLMSRDSKGPWLSVILGDPPEPLPGMGMTP